jgi:hypothetical protein
MNPRYFLHSLLLLSLLAATSALAQPTPFNDAIGDIDAGISTGGGTLDIVSMEVAETPTDLVFTLTVNGNVGSANWGKFMIGIANSRLSGTTSGNGWGRPINLDSPAGGMSKWIGSWVDGGNGAELFTYGESNWSKTGATYDNDFPGSLVVTPGTQSTITYTVTKASVDYEEGDVLFLDAYSSGGGGTDSAVDALSNPNVAITAWNQTYTSSITTGISRYPLPPGVTANITFRVDMNAQIAAGNFDPLNELVEVVPVGNTAFFRTDLNEIGSQPGVYEATISVTAPQDSGVGYRFSIVGLDADFPEDLVRTFAMPSTATTLPTVFFDNIEGYREVTFRVDMNAQIIAGTFDPLTQSVLVAGNFNGFSVDPAENPPLTDGNDDGIYEGTLLIGGTDGALGEYKFVILTGSSASYEFPGANRTATLQLNPDGAFTPAQVLPVALYGIPDNARPVTFTVDMSLEVASGRFNPAVDGVSVSGSFNDWNTAASPLTREGTTSTFSGTFNIGGDAGVLVQYKFVNQAPGTTGSTYEPGADRTLALGPVIEPQVLPSAVFGVTASQFRDVTFSIDMSVQVALGIFNPDEPDPAVGGIVQVRGIAGFDSGPQLTRQGTSNVYSGTFPVGGNGGSTFEYKFWSPGVNFYNVPDNTGFEQIIIGNPFSNRTVTLTAEGVAMELTTVYFSNQLFYVTGTPLSAFSTTEGTTSAPQNVTVNGQGLTADIVAAAPTGFEVSSDGITYGPTANLVPVSGSVTGTNNLFVRIAGSAAVGSPAGNVSLTSTGSQSVNIAVSGTVTAAANGYSNWLTNYPTLSNTNGTADPDGDGFNNNVEFAFDGNPTIGTPALMTVRSAGTNAVFNWVERKSGVTYQVQTNSTLTNSWSGPATVNISDSPDQSGVLLTNDYTRREFVVPAAGKQFYRIQATVNGN